MISWSSSIGRNIGTGVGNNLFGDINFPRNELARARISMVLVFLVN
jgi:hypothetical protein